MSNHKELADENERLKASVVTLNIQVDALIAALAATRLQVIALQQRLAKVTKKAE